MKRIIAVVAVLWQLPLSILSYLFFRIMRRYILKKANEASQKSKQESGQLFWIGLSEMMQIPNIIPYMMVTGPRWNCHAILGTIGPGAVDVSSNLEIQVKTAFKYTKQWTIVIYGIDDKTQKYISSSTIAADTHWEKVALNKGRYQLVLRYYNCEGAVAFPAIKVDGLEKIQTRQIENEGKSYEQFLNGIRNFQHKFFYCLHYYVFHLLRWKRLLPKSFVRKEYLPVGNPDTIFYYGSLRQGDRLHVDFPEKLLDVSDLYISYYNVCSFPTLWEPIRESNYKSLSMESDGHYLIRAQRKPVSSEAGQADMKIVCNVI